MGMIGLKIKDRTYDRLKWLKTRFEFVHETPLSWDEFFDSISRDVLLILAYDLKQKSGGNVSAEDIFSLLIGTRGKTGEGEDNEKEVFSMLSNDSSYNCDEVFTSLGDFKESVRKRSNKRTMDE